MPNFNGSRPMLATHSPTRRAYCRVASPRPEPPRPANKNSPGFLCQAQVIVEGLARLLGQLEPDGRPFSSAGPSRGRCVPVWGDVIDPYGHDVTATKLAVDREVEQGEIARSPFELQLRPYRPTWLGRSGGLGPMSLPLFHGSRERAAGVDAGSLSFMVCLLG